MSKMCISKFHKDDKDYLIVPTSYNDNDKILECLLKSILEVKEGYITYHATDGNYYSHTERVFAYELYRVWANNVDQAFGGEYVVNGEPEKATHLYRAHNTRRHKYPDLVLHHDQGDTKKQGIVCEIKRKDGFTKTSFRDDIEKLCFFVDECEYKFQYGTFVLVGECMDKIKKEVESILKSPLTFKKEHSSFEKIICITYNGIEMETVRLDLLINDLSKDSINTTK